MIPQFIMEQTRVEICRIGIKNIEGELKELRDIKEKTPEIKSRIIEKQRELSKEKQNLYRELSFSKAQS